MSRHLCRTSDNDRSSWRQEVTALGFFLISSGISLVLSAAMLWLLLHRIKINWQNKNHRPIGYLLPVLLTVVFILFTASQTIPRILDTIALTGRNLPTEELVLSSDEINWLTIEHNQLIFYYNRWKYQPQEDIAYRMSYTPYSRYILTLDELSDMAGMAP